MKKRIVPIKYKFEWERAFDAWWEKEQGKTMLHSKYLARKAWEAALAYKFKMDN